MTRLRTAALTIVALALGPPAARADFFYPNFSSTAGLQLNGNAAQAGSVLRLTPSAPGQGGSAFTTSTIALSNQASFSTYFQFRISNPGGISDGDGQGADGIVFVVQTVSNNVGSAGGGIGYLGINNSMGVEFDTWDNGGGFNDPNGNHVGIDTGGSFNGPTALEATRFNNGAVWNAWVDYNGTTNLVEVRWSPTTTRPGAAQLTRTVNLASVLGQTSAFVGFTSGTGSAFNDHDLLSWEFRQDFNPIGEPTGAPEPASLLSLGIGGVCLMGYRRVRRKAAAR